MWFLMHEKCLGRAEIYIKKVIPFKVIYKIANTDSLLNFFKQKLHVKLK